MLGVVLIKVKKTEYQFDHLILPFKLYAWAAVNLPGLILTTKTNNKLVITSQ